MKQVVQNYKSGELALLDVPEPACKPGGVLVRTLYSLISTGTELMKVSEASKSLLGKAKARPDQVAKVMQSVATNGLSATYRKVTSKLDSYTPLGYSLCGVVTAVGAGTDDVAVGDLVSCAGNEHALHAEVNWVPKNLYVRVPATLDPRHAAFGTVGSIAMQGVRRGEPALGDVALVIGLGLIGQLVVQLLVASGVKVIGADPDPSRCALAESVGAAVCAAPGSSVVETAVAELTGGFGVDQVYLAAGGSTNQPVELAAKLARDRGTVVDIGKCSLDLPWNAYYEKELDVRFSRSYGPGRYDPSYELEGRDYPIGYVRWTERRNIECFLDLAARDKIDVSPLITHVAGFDDAVETYRALNEGELKAVAVLFDYPQPEDTELSVPTDSVEIGGPPAARVGLSLGDQSVRVRKSTLRVGFVGAGNYASSMLLPHLVEDESVDLYRVVTTSALSATNAKRKFGFGDASTDLDELIEDDSVDAIFVVTRHSTHADLTIRALEAGKAVFVEKPLALGTDELTRILETVEKTGNDRLQVGFNRRFAPLLNEARQRFGRRIGPASVRYLVNAGRLDGGSWYNQDSEGTRFVGEGGHFIDTVSWLLGDDPVSVYAAATPGQKDLQAVLRYPDGSTATITYATNGSSQFQKETIDLTADGKVLRFDDFARASVFGQKKWASTRLPKGRDKGQARQVASFVEAVKTGAPMPVPLESLAATTLATLAVETSLNTGGPVRVETEPTT
ncbi:bi-domain-containing oxidoreductase [Actinophytocola oryzae]|uniref:Putative dehydrogenase n=1 Tax=Actinophytocola oryzae TaxID=502181 RepID=A0A4R7VD08_9PSEU|nr:bi-domain-containing oxidoreductase [Actinophytocola oryzae]TDV46905.1 putative dehydrogenase [Actinophytocola oryzae]